MVQSSGVSAADHSELSEYDEMDAGVVWRSAGACCDN